MLLEAMGLECRFLATDAEEAESHPVSPRALAIHNAAIKAEAAARALERAPDLASNAAASASGGAAASLHARAEETLVIAADTVVALGSEVLGKPTDADDARRMLTALSGRTHEVFTGIALRLLPRGTAWLDAERTPVTFRPLADEEIAAYVASGEVADKAGSYGVQGTGGSFIAAVEGDLSNVIGLPLERLGRAIAELTGLDPLAGRDRRAIVARAFPGQRPDLLERVR